MLDVAACAKHLLAVRSRNRRTLAEFLGLSEPDASSLAVLLAAFHDLGKFAAPFQRKAEGPEWPFARPRDALYGVSEHDRDGLALWHYHLGPQFGSRIWPGAEHAVKALLGASFGHHGRALATELRSPAEIFQPEGIAATAACVTELIDLLLPAPVRADSPGDRAVGAASFWFAGFVTIADWAGSGQVYFPYRAPDLSLAGYWTVAQQQAASAVRCLGLVSAPSGGPKSFLALTKQSRPPTPLQALVESVDLADGPVLVIIEDVTGAGKTEAAQVLVNRLMTADRAAGAYWAMPTQATANAMYERQRHVLAALFADGSRPQLVLSHGGARLHTEFQQTILRAAAASERTYGDREPDETATAACAAFLAEDSRAALIADLGAGTVDQAILGVLPARFQAVRLFGLSDKVLVIDEAHAYDAYMSAELRGLLQFQAALGGSAVVLSATLPRDVKNKAGREQLVHAWMEGCGARIRDRAGKSVVQRADYPLVTVVGAATINEYPVATAPWGRRSVPVRFVDQDDTIVEALVGAVHHGAAVAWVRNTVDDALEATDAIRRHGLEPITFHARFAQIDRQRIEAAVMARFGPGASADARRGSIVIATQVIEQSLDLDFDLMASDLAPIDLIIQRAGRLRRHPLREMTRPAVPFELIVRAPSFDEDPPPNWLDGPMRRTSFVYGDPAVLWRTMRALRERGVIETPDAMRALIEEVYAADAFVPSGLDPKSMKAEGIALAQGGRARQSLLSLVQGYRGEQMAWVSEDRIQVQTRLSAAQSVLRLARITGEGRLLPWAEGDAPLWNRWALSEVKVAAYRAPRGSAPLTRFEPQATIARAEWGVRERERDDFLLLPLERADDHWCGTLVPAQGPPITFTYWKDIGLKIS